MSQLIKFVPFQTDLGVDAVNVVTNAGVVLASISIVSNGHDWANIDIFNLEKSGVEARAMVWSHGRIELNELLDHGISIELRYDPS